MPEVIEISSSEDDQRARSCPRSPELTRLSYAAPAKVKRPAAASAAKKLKPQSDSEAEMISSDSESDDAHNDDDDDDDDEEEEEFDEEDSESNGGKRKKKPASKKKPAASASASASKPKAPAAKKLKSTKGTQIDFTPASGEEGFEKITKKAITEAKKAKKEQQTFQIAPKNEGEPPVTVGMDNSVAQKLDALKVGELKDLLRANKMGVSGTKPELFLRCLDGELNGAIPRCRTCAKGSLKYDFEADVYRCSGYFDTEIKSHMPCKAVVKWVQRVPWVTEAVPMEERETQDAPTSSAAAAAAAAADLFTAEELQPLATANDPKEAARSLLAMLRAKHVSLPEDEIKARTKVGSAIMSTRQNGVIVVEGLMSAVRSIVSEYPVKAPLAAATAGGGAAAAGGGASGDDKPHAMVPANDDVCNLLDELAKYEIKAGGEHAPFKARNLKKAASSIRQLTYEVIDGKSLAKGKTKVEGVGEKTALYIAEFLESGKTHSNRLDELKQKAGD